MSARFDAEGETPYAECNDCALVLQTQQDGRAHMNDTMGVKKNHRSHSIRITNRTRPERIRDFVHDTERLAVDDAVDDILEAIERGDLTAEEALAAPYCNSLVLNDIEAALK